MATLEPWWQVSVPKDVECDDDSPEDEDLIFTNFTFKEEDDDEYAIFKRTDDYNLKIDSSHINGKLDPERNCLGTNNNYSDSNGKRELDNLCSVLDSTIRLYSSLPDGKQNGNCRRELLRSMSWDEDEDEVRSIFLLFLYLYIIYICIVYMYLCIGVISDYLIFSWMIKSVC